jgi:pimeloyl-ACP methyl ester carboxylesterase
LSLQVRTSEGTGPTVVLCHGNSMSSEVYANQLEGAFARRFRVIAFDLPGHGEAQRASEPDTTYTLEGYSRSIVDVARALDTEGAVFVGWSLGGHALIEAMERLPKAAGFVLFGAPPLGSAADVGEALSPDPAILAAFRAESTDEEMHALLRMFVAPGVEVPRSFVDDFRRTDPRARGSLGASVGRGEVGDEASIVARLTRPLAILHGAHDAITMRAYFNRLSLPTLWRGAIQEIAQAGHSPQWETPEAFNALLEAFVLEVARPS